MRFSLTIPLLFIFCSTALPQQIYTYSDKDTLRVGEMFNFSIVIDNPPALQTGASPDTSFFTSVFELRGVQAFKPAPNRDSLSLTIQFFGTADTALYRVPIRYSADGDSLNLFTDIFPIAFQRTADEAAETEFRPLKPIFDFTIAWWPWLVLGILILISAYFIYRYFKNRPEPETRIQPVPEAIPAFSNPVEELEKELNRLKQDENLMHTDIKMFYLRLGDALRTYFEDLYHIPAMELTTREFTRELSAQLVDSHLSQIVIGILREADMVKFAKFKPWPDEAAKSLAAGFLFLERAKTMDRHKILKMRQEYDRRYFPEKPERNLQEVSE
jgi:hypothetical protein